MDREGSNEGEHGLSNMEELRVQTHESDNAWQLKSVPGEESEKWKMEKERYDEVIEYIREVDEILDLIRPFPREGSAEKRVEPPVRSDLQTHSRFGLDHLENIIKLVERLKEIQENNYKSGERICYLKDLRKLREHKKRLKNEELLIRNRMRVRSITSPEEYEMCLINRKSSSTSEKLEHEPKERWQDKRKSICLGENRSKVSKWTKVKEAFHWEKTSSSPKTYKKETCMPGEKNSQGCEGLNSEDHSPDDGLAPDVFCSPPSPPPPPPPPRVPRPENLLSVRPVQDLPSSSSSDRLDDFLMFSEMVKENKTSDLDSPSHPFGVDDIEEVEIVTRKSSCEELNQHLSKEEFATSRSTKSSKTAWGKVKDIIQTRKDSLKKKPKKRGSDEFKKRRKLSTISNPQFSDQFEDLSSPEEKAKNAEIIPKTCEFSEEVPPVVVEEKCTKRLTPALTVTLPSTEELRSFSFDDADRRDVTEEEKPNILSQFSCQAQYCEDKTKFGKNKSGSNQRLSRWIKVKRVFLTSSGPPQSSQYLPASSSSPTSQSKTCGFFSDLESDDLSSGEWIEDKSPSQEKSRLNYPELQSTAMTIIQEDIRKSYNELQKKLSLEFDQKLREWEVKSEVSNKLEDVSPKAKGDEGDGIPKFRRTRDSIAVPLPNLNDLSPEFKKKLNDWKKMKTSQSSSSVSSSTTKDDIQGQNIKIRIGEWQPWRTRCSGKGSGKGEQGSEECSKKVEEGQKSFGGSRPPATRRKEEDGEFASHASRRGSKRRDSVKKLSHSRTSSGADSLISTSSADKDGRFIRKSQKVKDFHWVEKELQKIEREKLRLEQEKEKYLEREARLEKMKKTMGTSPTQEILVRTPEGFVRFKGISQKFTKKLYEWEKARNIAPEASTFALLEESAQTGAIGDTEIDSVTMQRSKSTGSVPELSSTLLIQTMAHHPSSLSLNDVDELKTREEEVEEAISRERIKNEPEAIIVDVEDIVEETAVLAEGTPFSGETPVYTYTSEEIDQLIESSGRFYLADGFGLKIPEEKGSRESRGCDIDLVHSPQDTEKSYSGAKFISEDSENKAKVGFFESTENQRNGSVKSTTEKIQDAEENRNKEERKTYEDSFLKTTTTNSKCTNYKTKDMLTVKTENSGVTEFEIHVPALRKPLSQRVLNQRTGETEHEKHLPSDGLENRKLLFDKKSAQTKTDPEVLKRKIKEKITLMQRMTTEASWKYNDLDFKKAGERTSRQDENDETGMCEKKSALEEQPDSVCEPQETNNSEEDLEKSGFISIFVPTTRKIISPVKTTEGATPSVCSYVIDDVKPKTLEKLNQTERSPLVKKSLVNMQEDSSLPNSASVSPILRKKTDIKRDIGMPPLPNSPKMHKKLNPKETAPSIRMIIAKYNQKILEHDSTEGKRNEGGSPIWRSPVFGRRTQEKIEKYSAKDEGNGKRNGEVQKSASLDSMRTKTTNGSLTSSQDQDSQTKGILKSSSVGIMRVRPQNHEAACSSVNPVLDTFKETSPSVLRALKIQKAKEDFLSGRLVDSSGVSAVSVIVENPTDSETKIPVMEPIDKSEQNLIKSVSAETITSETSRSETRAENMSDVRPLQKSSSKFDISSIKSKFRKIRMRKEKESKLNAVAVLCRQSLFIEVPKISESSAMSKSCPSSPVMDRNKQEKSSRPPKKG